MLVLTVAADNLDVVYKRPETSKDGNGYLDGEYICRNDKWFSVVAMKLISHVDTHNFNFIPGTKICVIDNS